MSLTEPASWEYIMKTTLWVVLLLVVLSTAAYIYRRPIVLRLVGIRPFVEERFGWWIQAGRGKRRGA